MYIVVVSYGQPNTFAEVTCRHNLKILYHKKGLIVILSGRQT